MSLCIAVLGLGAWGTTLTGLLQQQGHRIQGWSRRDGGGAPPAGGDGPPG